MKNTSKLNLTEQYKEHSAETDKIVEALKELVATNKIMHDGLGEAQTMIGERELENMDLRKQLHRASITING